MNLPNKLSVIRIALVPIIIIIELFPYNTFGISLPLFTFMGVSVSLKNIILLIIFVFACITDYLDGNIARRKKLVTSFGKFIDPVADKAIINTMFIILAYNHSIPVLPVIIMILRDIVVDGCRMIASSKGVVVAADFYGKLKTVTQMISIILVLLNNFPFEAYNIQFSTVLVWFTALISAFSGYNYFRQVKEYLFESM